MEGKVKGGPEGLWRETQPDRPPPLYHCGRKRYIVNSENVLHGANMKNLHLLTPKNFMHVSLTCPLTCWGMIRM